MKEQFATFEICKELKELGFDEECMALYYKRVNETEIKFFYDNYVFQDKHTDQLASALLWQQVIEWLIEKHNINPIIFGDGFQWTFDLRWKDEDSLSSYPFIQFPKDEKLRTMFDLYSEARKQAILKAIEIIKSKE